ncbi:MAG: VOC family protein [Bacteroidetes bacterium]|nr:VOC family protein [Bacteroidota bacterium]MBL6943409.1 VOC family protein [Bacteroidales bacterium]
MKIHHIGYAVRDIEKSLVEFELIGFKKVGELYNDTERNVIIQLMKNDTWLIELVAPCNENSPIFSIIEKNNNTPYHFCFCTDSISQQIDKLRSNNYVIIEPAKPAMAFDGRLVAFLYHKYIGIIELLECKQ